MLHLHVHEQRIIYCILFMQIRTIVYTMNCPVKNTLREEKIGHLTKDKHILCAWFVNPRTREEGILPNQKFSH